MHGRMSAADKDVMVQKDFQGIDGEPKYDVLVGTFRLMGRVYTMARARRTVLFSPIWVKTEEDQARFRVQRIGQTRETFALRYVADQTIDTLVLRRQEQKDWFDARVLGRVDSEGQSLSVRDLLKWIGLDVHDGDASQLEKEEDENETTGDGNEDEDVNMQDPGEIIEISD